ncbi:nucleotidyltransferase family protein [Okeania sp. SIO1I7]|uniref:nucleotidyltransferase family protein n=1 Tax=Okeania sp. SIO1I7 TaxID=2607772 RepID=UPI0013FC7CAA|nr:nucleotidyltransferase domain-containing protein [Okeania sp. SIO1I7]NET26433.1 DNA polymerase subunit beta [Okeania sp. SIO1I7]
MLKQQQKVNLKVILTERLKISYSEIAEFCQHCNITELALFGSVLREDFHPNSDVDILVVYDSSCQLTLSKLLDMQKELEIKFGRAVDLVEKAMIKNPYRLANILKTYQVIYAKQ